MPVRAFVSDVLRHPGEFVNGMACGLDNETRGDEGDSIAWTTGYVTGELGPYAAIPATAYILKSEIGQYVAQCL